MAGSGCTWWSINRCAVALLAAVVVLIGTGLPSARADEFIRDPATANPNTDGKPDDWFHSYCWDATTFQDLNWKSVTAAQMEQVDVQSTYGDVGQDVCDPWEHSNVVFIAGTVGTPTDNVLGREDCQTWTSGGECTQSFITLDTAEMAWRSYTTNGQQGITCHEIGHSLGLTHNTTNDCMNSSDPSGNVHGKVYDAHHVAHLQQSHDSPTGNLDYAGGIYGYTGLLQFAGWALDPDVRWTPQVYMRVKIDVTWFSYYLANMSRPDIAVEYPFWSQYHGYDIRINTGGGCHTISVEAQNAAGGGGPVTWGPAWVCSY
jgi:hypothetical protein